MYSTSIDAQQQTVVENMISLNPLSLSFYAILHFYSIKFQREILYFILQTVTSLKKRLIKFTALFKIKRGCGVLIKTFRSEPFTHFKINFFTVPRKSKVSKVMCLSLLHLRAFQIIHLFTVDSNRVNKVAPAAYVNIPYFPNSWSREVEAA